MIVDSSAIVAILLNEPDAEQYRMVLERSQVTRLSAGNYVELGVVIDGRRSKVASHHLDNLLAMSRIIIEPVTESQARIAREAYRDYGRGSGHAANLNFGDCFAYALARDKREPLLFKGTDFDRTDIRPALPRR
jgi:ribonuclease VapC